jgi:hypothetical protein
MVCRTDQGGPFAAVVAGADPTVDGLVRSARCAGAARGRRRGTEVALPATRCASRGPLDAPGFDCERSPEPITCANTTAPTTTTATGTAIRGTSRPGTERRFPPRTTVQRRQRVSVVVGSRSVPSRPPPVHPSGHGACADVNNHCALMSITQTTGGSRARVSTRSCTYPACVECNVGLAGDRTRGVRSRAFRAWEPRRSLRRFGGALTNSGRAVAVSRW